MDNYDLKVGFSCNNNCIHCVVKPYITNEIDLTYQELITKISTSLTASTKSIVLTGGEITIRKDFQRIVRYISKVYPNIKICIQTNGRKLLPHLDFLNNIKNLSLTIAIHSCFEDIHNNISCSKAGNPFLETNASLKEILKYPYLLRNTRLEIVLSNHNKDTIYETIKHYFNKGYFLIGISYPHLDGYINEENIIKDISFPVNKLALEFNLIKNYMQQNKSKKLFLESVPYCVFSKNNIADIVPSNIFMTMNNNKNIEIVYPDRIENNFSYRNQFSKPNKCEKCLQNNCCDGIWTEALIVFGENQLNVLKGCEQE